MLITVLGVVATLATWSQYPGMFHQIALVWSKRVKSGLAPKLVRASLVRNVAFMLWGASFFPVDWIMFLSRVPGIFISSFLAMQLVTPRPSPRRFVPIFVCTAIGISGAGIWIYLDPVSLEPARLVLRVVGFFATFDLVTRGLYQQLQRIRRDGTGGLSGPFMVCAWFGFAAWFAYAIATERWDLILCYGIGTFAQGRVLLAFRASVRRCGS